MLLIEAKKENLDAVTAFVNGKLQACGYPPDLQNEVDIAVEEIFINIANYAYMDTVGNVKVFVSVKDGIFIKFEDSGVSYNPLDEADPDLEKPPADREVGGLGIFMVKKLMDTVEYSRENGKNILKISRKIPR
jgi:anti-sigma regulatory factor (Ser/Thr protein kinase)